MSGKQLIPIAIGGGLLYYYDQNVNPIISSHFQNTNEQLKETQTAISKDLKKNEAKAKSQYQQTKEKVESESKAFASSIEQQYNKLESKTSDLYKNLKFTSDDVNKQAKETKNKIQNELINSNDNSNNLIRSTIASYIDFINDVGDSITGSTSKIDPKVIAQEKKQNSWFNWGATLSDNAMEKFDFDKAKTINEYENSKAKLTKLNKEWQDKNLTIDQQKVLHQAQTDFQNSLSHLSNYGKEFVDSTNKRLENASNSWWNWSSNKKDQLSEQYEQQKSSAIKKYEETKKKLDSLASKTFKTEQEKTDYLKEAQSSYDDAMKDLSKFGSNLSQEINQQLSDAKKSWWNWSSKQKENFDATVEDQRSKANEQYELAKKKYDEVVAQIKSGLLPEKEKEDHLKRANDDLNSAWSNLKKVVS